MVGFISGCIYSDIHWKKIIDLKYKKIIQEYRKVLGYKIPRDETE
jgi:hypothetical protein